MFRCIEKRRCSDKRLTLTIPDYCEQSFYMVTSVTVLKLRSGPTTFLQRICRTRIRFLTLLITTWLSTRLYIWLIGFFRVNFSLMVSPKILISSLVSNTCYFYIFQHQFCVTAYKLLFTRNFTSHCVLAILKKLFDFISKQLFRHKPFSYFNNLFYLRLLSKCSGLFYQYLVKDSSASTPFFLFHTPGSGVAA